MTRFRRSSLPLKTLSLVPLLFFRAKVSTPLPALEGILSAAELAYHINACYFSRFNGVKIVLGSKCPAQNPFATRMLT